MKKPRLKLFLDGTMSIEPDPLLMTFADKAIANIAWAERKAGQPHAALHEIERLFRQLDSNQDLVRQLLVDHGVSA